MRFEIERQQRAQHARVAHRGRQLQHPRVLRSIDEPEVQADGGGAAVRALERDRQRLEQAGEHE